MEILFLIKVMNHKNDEFNFQFATVLHIDLKEQHSTSIILKQTKNVFLKLGTI